MALPIHITEKKVCTNHFGVVVRDVMGKYSVRHFYDDGEGAEGHFLDTVTSLTKLRESNPDTPLQTVLLVNGPEELDVKQI